MKKVLIMAAVLLFTATISYAGVSDVIKNIPDLKQGIMLDMASNEYEYLMTTAVATDIAGIKGLTIEAGYSSESSLVGVISYKLLALKDYVNLPILDLVELNAGYGVGVKRIGSGSSNNEYTHGFTLTAISVKF